MNSPLIYILAATLLGGALSVLAAAWLSFKVLGKLVQHMVSLSTGLLLGTSLLHLVPEAFHDGLAQGMEASQLSTLLLGGLLAFFLLEKFSLIRHNHHFEGDGHYHHHGHDREHAGRGGLLILVGDSIHNFADGILIAAAFASDIKLGWAVTLSIVAHEIPQEVGDFMVLLNAGFTRTRALCYNLISSLAAVVGGVLGYFIIGQIQQWMPYALILAASCFIYIAVADLIPQMQKRVAWRESLLQVALIGVGLLLVTGLRSLSHS